MKHSGFGRKQFCGDLRYQDTLTRDSRRKGNDYLAGILHIAHQSVSMLLHFQKHYGEPNK